MFYTERNFHIIYMYFDLQGVNSFVRESRKAVIRELLNLQEMVDAIMAGKMIEGTVSKGA